MISDDMTFGPYENAEHNAQAAFELYEEGKIPQALTHLQQALDINPSSSALHFNKALALDTTNRFDEAITEYESALELKPLDCEILNSLAVDYTRTGQYDLAISTFEYIQQINPDYEAGYCNRIITYTEMGLHDLAEEMFYLAQQIDPDCALCYYNIGNCLFIQGQYKKAINCWQKTMELASDHPQINYRIAQAYWADGNIEFAHEYFLSELRANPGDVNVILDFGLFLLETGQIESAKEKFNRILELTPDSAAALFYLGEIAFNENNFEKATELFNQSLQKNYSFVGPRYRLAQCALMENKEDQCQAYLISELKLDPTEPQALISMGSMFLKISEIDYAVHCLLKAIELDYANADAYYFLGLAHADNSNFTEAAEFFNHTLDINSEHICALKNLALVYFAMGKLEDADEKLCQAKKLTPADPGLKTLAKKIWLAKKSQSATRRLRKVCKKH